MRVVLVAVIAVLAVGTAGSKPARAATRAAMIPLVAESLLPGARDALDRDLRAAFDDLGVEVQPADETNAHIEEGSKSGLECSLTEDDCAIRVGRIADVDVVITAKVEVLDRDTVLRAAWLDTRGKPPRRITGAFTLPALDRGASLKNLVGLLVTGKGKPAQVPVRVDVEPESSSISVDGRSAHAGVLFLLPGPHVVRVEAPGRTPVEKTLEVSPEGQDAPLLIALDPVPVETPFPVTLAAGIGVGITGAVVAAVAGSVALLIENDLDRIMPAEERKGRETFGQAAVVVTALSAAMAAAGAGLSVVGAME